MDGTIVSCFSMTEPQAGADPKEFACKAWQDGNEWVIDGEKWFSSNARHAAFLIIMAVTNPENPPHQRMSMFVVPIETPGIEFVRNIKVMGDNPEGDEGIHGYMRYNQVRVPLDAMLGGPGEGTRSPRRDSAAAVSIMRCAPWGVGQRAFEMMLERAQSRRAQSRRAQGRVLADHQFVQGMIADSAIELEQFRLLVLKTAWIIDTNRTARPAPTSPMCKVQMAKLYHDIVQRAIQVHGSLGITLETPSPRCG